MDGVERVIVGYTGGKEKNPTYQSILDATEAVLIEYNPEIISYEKILESWSKQHNPQYEQKTQYRSAIWIRDDEQRKAAMERIEIMKQNQSGIGSKNNKPRKIYVDVEPVGPFYKAEEYHQDYLLKHTGGTGFF